MGISGVVDGARVEARRLIIRDDGGSDQHKGKQRVKDDCDGQLGGCGALH